MFKDESANGIASIGVVGGVGPLATTFLYNAIVDRFLSTGNGNLPEIFVYSVPMNYEIESAFISNPLNVSRAIFQRVAEMLKKPVDIFKATGIKRVVMPCNTLQPILQKVCDEAGISNIDIVEETIKRAVALGLENVLVIGTATTRRSNLYGSRLESWGIKYRYLPESCQPLVSQHILHLLQKPNLQSPHLMEFTECVRQASQSVDGIIIGCTDLVGQLRGDGIQPPVIDSLYVLADTATEYLIRD